MDETQKPFACKAEGCTMSFTNLDHLNVHTKKHAMSLQLSLGNKAATFVGNDFLTILSHAAECNKEIIQFTADQTPTPTRLIRNCDEVGLFEDLHLQHVNPFEETFRQAVESKHCSSITPTLDHGMIMDDSLPQDETTLHTPNVLPYYDITNCTFKEESISMGDDVIAGQSTSDNDLDECSFNADKGGTTNTKVEGVEDGDIQTQNSDKNVNVPIDVKMEEIVVIDKPRPPALILSKNPSTLSSNFKKIVDETLSDETNTLPSQPTAQNLQTIVVKPLPKLTRILPMVPVTTTTDRIVKFGTTPKILQINLNEPSKRLLLPKSRSVEEKSISVKDRLKATILKATMECETVQTSDKRSVKNAVMIDKKMVKKNISDKMDDKLKVSRNRAAAKRYR